MITPSNIDGPAEREVPSGFADFLISESDKRALETLANFVPPRIFDAHAHFYDASSDHDDTFSREFGGIVAMDAYIRRQNPLYPGLKRLRLNLIPMPNATMANRSNGSRRKCTEFLVSHLQQHPHHVAECFVLPDDTRDDIRTLLLHPNIRGFKCYHLCAAQKPTWQADIGAYLPESAWQIADEKGFCITLHMVKDHALADAGNLQYILHMARKYPSAKLILAHAARGFAAWTVLDSARRVADIPNVYFDVSAVCEPAPIFAALKAAGAKRVLWGSDFPISLMRGKCISIADTFLWLYREQLQSINSKTPFAANLIGIENLNAVMQACKMLDLNSSAIDDIFYNNAMRMFNLTDDVARH